MRPSNVSQWENGIQFLLTISRILFFSCITQDTSLWILLLFIRCRKFMEKKKIHKSPRSFLLHITFCILNPTSSFLCSFTKFHSNTFCAWDTGTVELARFCFPCPSFRKGSPRWQYFGPDHPLWIPVGLPKPLTAVLSHALWDFRAHRD